MKEQSLKGISRIQSRGAGGWLVRLYWNTKVVSKLFSDGIFGGTGQSLNAAQAYYQQLRLQFPPEAKPPFREKTLQNNTSGYNGICETFSRTKKGGKIFYWNVSWYNPPNRLNSKKFYFHDDEERRQALSEALKFRKEREAEILKRLHKSQK